MGCVCLCVCVCACVSVERERERERDRQRERQRHRQREREWRDVKTECWVLGEGKVEADFLSSPWETLETGLLGPQGTPSQP